MIETNKHSLFLSTVWFIFLSCPYVLNFRATNKIFVKEPSNQPPQKGSFLEAPRIAPGGPSAWAGRKPRLKQRRCERLTGNLKVWVEMAMNLKAIWKGFHKELGTKRTITMVKKNTYSTYKSWGWSSEFFMTWIREGFFKEKCGHQTRKIFKQMALWISYLHEISSRQPRLKTIYHGTLNGCWKMYPMV